jgi:ADP-ribose pyrophosphatase YjhB (NUDIX family)
MENHEDVPRLRVAAVITRRRKILLVKHRKSGLEYFMLPGGGVLRGESMTEALSREVEEETGLQVQAGKLLCVSETIYPDRSRHIVHLVFRGIERGGELRPSRDVRVAGADFYAFNELSNINLLPLIGGFLRHAHRIHYHGGGVYLKTAWKDMEG